MMLIYKRLLLALLCALPWQQCYAASVAPVRSPIEMRNERTRALWQQRKQMVEKSMTSLEGTIAALASQLRTTKESALRAPLIKKWHDLHGQKNQLQKQLASLNPSTMGRKNAYVVAEDKMRAVVKRRQEAKAFNAEQVSLGQRRENPLMVLSRTKSDQWQLHDPDLEFELNFTLRDEKFLGQILQLRYQEIEKWREWQKHTPGSTASDTAYALLRTAMIKGAKQVLKNHKVDQKMAPQMADRFIRAAIGDTGFIQEMVAHIAGRGGVALSKMPAIEGYEQLFLLLLGYDYESSSYHSTDKVRMLNQKTEKLSDLACMRQSIAQILIAYRTVYDAEYSALRADLEYSFLRLHEKQSAIQRWIQRWREDEYLRPLHVSSTYDGDITGNAQERAAYEQWLELRSKSMAQAHAKAREAVADILEEVASAMTALSARLDVLRVSDKEFSYPSIEHASNEELSFANVYSILAGLLCRCIKQGFVVKTGFGAQTLHNIFVEEMVWQRKTGHIPSDIPADAAGPKTQPRIRVLQRLSYEAKMYTLVSSGMDVFRGEGELEVKTKRGLNVLAPDRYVQVPIAEATAGFNLPYARGLYETMLALYGKLNLIQWQLPSLQSRQTVLEELNRKLIEVATYLGRIDLDVSNTSPVALGKVYGDVLRRLIPWKKSRSITFEKPESLREALRATFSKEQRKEHEMASFRATYQLLWLCIWQRLRKVVQMRDRQTAVIIGDVPGSGTKGFTPGTLVTNAEFERQQAAAQVGKKSKVTEAVATLKEELGGVSQHFSQIGKSIKRQSDALQHAAIDKFAEKGDLSGIVNHMNSLLSEVGSVLPGFNKVLSSFHKQSEKTYDHVLQQVKLESERLLATIKALMTYVFWLNRYSDRKIKGLQGTLSELLNNWVVRMVSKAGAKILGSRIRKALQHVSEEDAHLQRKMKESLDDVTAAWKGQRKSTELVGIPDNEVSVVAPRPVVSVEKGYDSMGDLAASTGMALAAAA